MTKVEKPYGTWPSPLTAEDVAATPGAPQWPSVVGDQTWWCAPDPATATVGLTRRGADGTVRPVLAAGWPVGNKAIGYGGRPYLATPDLAVFSCSRDQRLYLIPDALTADHATEPLPLTPADAEGVTRTNYSDMIIGPTGTEIWAIREVYEIAPSTRLTETLTDPAPRTTRDVVAVPLSGAAADDPAALRVVARSHHFLTGLRLSPDGTRLSWIGWNHPVMPWESTDLMVASLVDGVAVAPRRVLGGDEGSLDTPVSVPQAEWADADTLYALADPDGWWNLFRVDLAGAETVATNVFKTETECGHAIWRVGSTSFALTDAGVVLRRSLGDEALVLWDPETGDVTDLAPDWTEFATAIGGGTGGISGVGSVGASLGTEIAVVAASPTEPSTPLRIDVAHRSILRCVERAEYPHEAWVAVPERRHVQVEGGWQVPYIYHPPTNPEYQGPADTPPPLLIDVHGGPTSSTVATRYLNFALFTSRGYAVASVDYGGSTGYGRAYRDRLRHTWGITDVEDSVAVARALAAAGLADPARTAIRGGSAGGWTTLAALAHSDYFACGTVYFPISDPATWYDEQTHDFESRYIHYLVGDPVKDAERFARVSPLAHAAEVTAPFIMLQGLDDVICRPDQADRMVKAVEAANPGLCRAYHRFPGEGHGFRKDETMTVCLQAELDLYASVLGA